MKMKKSVDIKVADIVKEYGNTEMKFDSYYKFSFTFIGEHSSGTKISASIGGVGDDIYRLTVTADGRQKLSELAEWSEVVINITFPDGAKILVYT